LKFDKKGASGTVVERGVDRAAVDEIIWGTVGRPEGGKCGRGHGKV